MTEELLAILAFYASHIAFFVKGGAPSSLLQGNTGTTTTYSARDALFELACACVNEPYFQLLFA